MKSIRQKFLKLWTPLLVTWIFMALEGPIVSAFLSHRPESEFNLAAYGITFAFALVVESPVIMLMSAAITLVSGRQSYIALRRYSMKLIMGVSLVMFIVLIPSVYHFVTNSLLSLPPEVAARAYQGLWGMSLWPALVGWRRFYQGCLIARHKTLGISLERFCVCLY